MRFGQFAEVLAVITILAFVDGFLGRFTFLIANDLFGWEVAGGHKSSLIAVLAFVYCYWHWQGWGA